MTGRMVKSQSPGRRTFCLASGGCKVQQTRPWLGLVDLSRIPKILFFGRSILARKLPAKITGKMRTKNFQTMTEAPAKVATTEKVSFGFWCWWALANLERCGRVYV